MDYSGIRKLFLRVFLGFLVLTALIAIIAVLRGEFGEFQVKILVTSATISVASICSMSCISFVERKQLPALGLTGVVFSIAATLMTIVAMWGELDGRNTVQTIMSLWIISVAFAHGFLLSLPVLDEKGRWTQPASSVSITLLAIMLVSLIWGDFRSEIFFRVLAVVSIVVGLLTLVVPLLMKLRKGVDGEAKRLVLTQIGDALYEDRAGRRFEVTEESEKSEDSVQ